MKVLTYVLLLLGLFEIVSNLFHISKKSADKIGASAKRQHQEISLSLPNIHFYYKCLIMFAFGFLFLIAGIFSYYSLPFSSLIVWIAVIGLGLYGVIQAIIYRTEIRVWPAMIVYNIPLLLKIFI